ncbi:hypothetical protein ACFU8R_13810 [Pseudonocardia alni]|jgi:hypothetical protein|uniref:Secreted protein n=1 Tax=Pseudonocardia alni TaxID=33907 RepID=A0A852VXQ8_PSEA5|nr:MULTISPECIES: hypothetical protein [Pseudonocardia]OJG08553.1 hypothetical protein BG618_00446 [Pseudonocardia autotrophica]MCO7191688.1 hypothetical protein [Pseudonocardia sp. McavD-2-B]MYW71782.1 hypothetical protein [Pseudonocardia sp. SID8383]NYG00939.1 hypothetical protein [Pseudonocardia antarctica]PKB33384.1 hypothetical protein ATL51_5141 [Pseudonocardia alni]
MSPDVMLWVVVAVVVLVVLGLALVVGSRVRGRRRTAALRRHFGQEYDHVVEQSGGKDRGETELRRRLSRRRELDVRDLDADERERFAGDFAGAQNAFVRTPRAGLRDTDLLLQQVMRTRGYPVEHFSEREEMISVDHPDLVGHYRAAHAVAVAEDDADTESLRRAMLDHGYLFDELIGAGHPESTQRTLPAS